MKNDHVGFEIPYLFAGVGHSYVPDFLVRLQPDGEGVVRTLIIEVSGTQKDQHMREAKATTARDMWCVAVNNHGGFGRWGYVEISDMTHAAYVLKNAITDLYQDGVTTGASV